MKKDKDALEDRTREVENREMVIEKNIRKNFSRSVDLNAKEINLKRDQEVIESAANSLVSAGEAMADGILPEPVPNKWKAVIKKSR